jgi:hypothetical protein
MEPRLLLLAVVLLTIVSSQADLKEDATEYGEKLAQDLFEHGERNQEAIYRREVTGANMYGYHSPSDIDAFVAVASHVAHEKGAELEEQALKASQKAALVSNAFFAVLKVEGDAARALNDEYFQASMRDPLNVPLQTAPTYPLGIMTLYERFKKAYEDGSMTAQEVYDATMKDIAEKTAPAPTAPNTAGAPTSASLTVTSAITRNRWSGDSLIL